ncbi:MAG: RidA family protein [Desulfurellaceae bacterium]|nr:RidA family protein [Desulfurellaceae bacterium]
MKKEAIFPESLPLPRVAYSPAVKAGPFVFISGQLASDFKTGIPPEAAINPNFPNHGLNIERQASYIADNLRLTLEAAGSSLEQCVSLTLYHTDAHELHGAAQVLRQTFGAMGVPPHTSVILEELPVPDCTLEVDLVGFVSETGQRPEIIQAASLPQPVIQGLNGQALYQYGVKAGEFIFTTGMTATDFSAGVAPEAQVDPNFPYYAESARLQTEYILEAQQAVLQAAGASLADVVKAEVYMTDIRDFYRLEQIWKKYFPTDPPARTTAPVSDLGVPGLRIAINLIAYSPQGGPAKRTIRTDAAPIPLAHEPQAVQAGPFLFFSGQMATDYRTGIPAEARIDPNFPYYASAAEKGINYVVKNIDAICAAAGTSRDYLLRRRGFYTDFGEFFTSFVTWAESFPNDPPASTTVRVPGPLLVPGCKVVIDLIGMVPDESA